MCAERAIFVSEYELKGNNTHITAAFYVYTMYELVMVDNYNIK